MVCPWQVAPFKMRDRFDFRVVASVARRCRRGRSRALFDMAHDARVHMVGVMMMLMMVMLVGMVLI